MSKMKSSDEKYNNFNCSLTRIRKISKTEIHRNEAEIHQEIQHLQHRFQQNEALVVSLQQSLEQKDEVIRSKDRALQEKERQIQSCSRVRDRRSGYAPQPLRLLYSGRMDQRHQLV